MNSKILVAGLILITMLPQAALADKVLSADLMINYNDTASLLSMSLVEGNLIDLIPGDYSAQILDSSGNVLASDDFMLEFFLFTDPPKDIDTVLIEVRFSSFENAEKLQALHSGEVIFESPVALCDGNSVCDGYENYVSCPSDCPSGSADDYCDHMIDGICDPDCAEQADVDCQPKEGAQNNYLKYILAGAGLLILILLLFFILKKRK